MSEPEALTAEDLRSKLYHSLREKGLVDSLKTQLRNKLVTELKHAGIQRSYQPEPIYAADGSLLQKAANSLVADHMKRCCYDYSLSVFLPESGTAEDKIFTTRDLLQLLNISPHSRLYKHLSAHSSQSQKFGFLWQLLCEIAAQHGSSCQDTGCQTDAIKLAPPTSLEEQFRKLDEYYLSKSENGMDRSSEERILSYQRQLEERARSEIQLEIARFKENELARMRMEEKEKCRQEIERLRKEMERAYRAKADGLIERERNSTERLQQQQEIQEKDTFTQRQAILDEIEAVRQREVDIRRQSDLFNREKALLEDRMKSSEDSVKKRELAVKQKEVEYEQKLRDETSKYKLEQQSMYLQRTTDLEFRESKVKQDQLRLDDELQEIKQIKDELRQKRMLVNELEADLSKTRHDLLTAQKQGELYSERLHGMVDYQILKEDSAVLRKEVDSLKMRLAESAKQNQLERQKQEDLLREMTVRASQPTPETVLLTKETEKLKDVIRQEQAISEHHKQQLQRKLQDEIDRNREIMRKYNEQNMIQKEMNQEISNLRQQLLGTKEVLSNEIHQRPLRQASAPSQGYHGRDLYADENSYDDYIDANLERDGLTPDPGTDADVDPKSLSEDQSYSFDLVKDTRRRLKNLEREAENLEDNYRNFQFRMTSVQTALPSDLNESQLNRSKVSFRNEERTNRAYGEHSPRSRSHNISRPMSSTPSRISRPPTQSPRYDTNQRPPHLDLDRSVSTVHSDDQDELGRQGAVVRNREISLKDLEARPGSPSVLHVEGSDTSSGKGRKALSPSDSSRVTPSGQERSEPLLPPVSLDGAWNKPQVSLDSAWKSDEQKKREEEERRKREEEEEREYEERRRLREEEKKRKEEEQWEAERKALEELERGQSAESEPNKDEEQEEAKAPDIDPVMQKYMEMVQQQKEKEKTIAKKTMDTWTKGRKMTEKTPSQSEDDLSVPADKSPRDGSDEDFDW